jgi:hypothetical protein
MGPPQPPSAAATHTNNALKSSLRLIPCGMMAEKSVVWRSNPGLTTYAVVKSGSLASYCVRTLAAVSVPASFSGVSVSVSSSGWEIETRVTSGVA